MQRPVLIFAICLPLAVLMGFMLSDPLAGGNLMMGGLIVMILTVPLFITYHHRALIWTAMSYTSLYLMKGKPQLWMVLAGVSFLFAVISKPLGKSKLKPVWTRELIGALFLLSLVVGATMTATGGVGLKSIGSSTYGGKKYVLIFAAIIGIIAITAQALPRKTALLDVSIYTLAPITAAFSNIAYMLGPSFYFLFLLFPSDMAVSQAMSEMDLGGAGGMKRITGFGSAGVAIVYFGYLRWGLAGILDFTKPWRGMAICGSLGLALVSGFRSTLGVVILLTLAQLFAEGLHRTRAVWKLAGIAAVAFGILAVFAEQLPLGAQRVISFLPVKINPLAAQDAKSSTEWRLEMWSLVRKDIPKYFWLGKGYVIDPSDLYFAGESVRRGFANDYEFSIQAGDYHSGPFSIIIPFGIWGVLAVSWLFWVFLKIVWHNYRYGEDELKKINVFLFSLYVSRLTFFIFFFGGIEVDIWYTGSIAALSLSVNGGMRQKPQPPRLRYEPQAIRAREAALASI